MFEVKPVYETYLDITWLFYPELDSFNLAHGIGVFKNAASLVHSFDYLEGVRYVFSRRFASSVRELIVPHQVHGSHISIVSSAGPGVLMCDGLITSQKDLALGISVADCIPLLAFHPGGRVVGVAHCGWRGIASGIVREFCNKIEVMGFAIGEIFFLLGPAIGLCCYEVGEDVLLQFDPSAVGAHSSKKGERLYLDLKAIVVDELQTQGVEQAKILIDKTCTSCQKSLLTSYRASGPECGRMLAVIAS